MKYYLLVTDPVDGLKYVSVYATMQEAKKTVHSFKSDFPNMKATDFMIIHGVRYNAFIKQTIEVNFEREVQD